MRWPRPAPRASSRSAPAGTCARRWSSTTSTSRFRDYDPFGAYGQSKTANVLFAVEATRRWAGDGITANALMPGGIATPLQRHLARALRRAGAGGVSCGRDRLEVGRAGSCDVGAAGGLAVARRNRRPLLRGLQRSRGGQPPRRAGRGGVAPYALDPANAERLWELSLKLVG